MKISPNRSGRTVNQNAVRVSFVYRFPSFSQSPSYIPIYFPENCLNVIFSHYFCGKFSRLPYKVKEERGKTMDISTFIVKNTRLKRF